MNIVVEGVDKGNVRYISSRTLLHGNKNHGERRNGNDMLMDYFDVVHRTGYELRREDMGWPVRNGYYKNKWQSMGILLAKYG